MRIAFPYPSYWPYVRRGAERCIHDLAVDMARRGHEVDIVTSTPGRSRVAHEEGVRITYLRQLSNPLMYRYAPWMRVYGFSAEATAFLAATRPDVAHMWSFTHIDWAPLLRRAIDLPYLLHIIMRNHYWSGRAARLSFANVVRSADQVVALTQGGADATNAEYGLDDCGVLSPPVDMGYFHPASQRDRAHPVVLFPADLADVRKGGALLLRAWNKVHAQCPSARLALAGPFGLAGYHQSRGETMLTKLDLVHDRAAREAIELRGPGDSRVLPFWYSAASVTVLPSVEEAFGMVLTESLACGTPVVSSKFDGPGEIITDERIGRTVALQSWADLDSTKLVEDLADAILEAIELAQAPGTTSACREWASQWSLESVGDAAEAHLTRIVDEHRGRRGRRVARAVA
jgi:glycosyltransferase involved in cell wall biosynthesis